MRIPLSWLRDHVEVILPPEELANRLTMAGFEVGDVEVVGEGWDCVEVGRVVDIQPHPSADLLRLVTVELGDSRPTVVCGAPNVEVGHKVPFASVGAELTDSHTGQKTVLRPAKIRGIVSEGMVCSENELGISDEHEGIMILPPEAPVGIPLAEYLGDVVLDVDVPPNRPDCLSVIGIAREVAAVTGQMIRLHEVDYPEGKTGVGNFTSVEILDADLCPRYCASIVTGIGVGPSPHWMQQRLQSCGMRSINNVVDVTNYVMLEYGQPLHAFDYEEVTNRKIVIRRATDGEVIISLDGTERGLNREILVIGDDERAVAVAGVMGGLNSEVSGITSTVLLESANFNQASIRRTSAILGLRSEASLRFDKGLPAELTLPALQRATQLMVETAGGETASGIIDVYPGEQKRRPVTFPTRDVKRLLGMEVSEGRIWQILESLGFVCGKANPSEWEVTVPYWRTDVVQSADLVEEVGRIVGYDKIPTTVISAPIPTYEPSPLLRLKEGVQNILVACGMQEIITYSLTNLENLQKVTPDMSLLGPMPLRIANPMSREYECLRTSLRPRLLLAMSQNRRHEDSVRVFEIGRVYLPRTADLPREIEMLCGVLVGARQEVTWRTKEDLLDFFDAKGILEALFRSLRVEAEFVSGGDAGFRQGKCADVMVGSEKIGVLGELHPRVVENFGVSGAVCVFEMDLERLLPAASGEVKYRPLPRFPESIRDIAVVVDAAVGFQDILDIVKGFPLVKEVALFDVYTGDQMPEGKKSLAFRIVYQSPEQTLTDGQVNKVQQQITDAFTSKLGAILRS